MNVLLYPLLFADLQGTTPPQWATETGFEFPAALVAPPAQGLVYIGSAWKLPLSMTYAVTTSAGAVPPTLTWTVSGPDGDVVTVELLTAGLVAASKSLTLAANATGLSLAVTSGGDPYTDDISITMTPVSAVDRTYAPNVIGGVMTAYVSAANRGRVHVSELYANETARLVANFNGALNRDRNIAEARWDTYATPMVNMTGAENTDKTASVLVACGYAGPAVIKCTVTLDNGEKLVQQFRINVLPQPVYAGETYPSGSASAGSGTSTPPPAVVAGPPGQSAYQIAVNHGFVGSEAAWLDSLEGSDGDDGDDGATAYELAVAGGFVGSEAAWLASLEGEDGDDGSSAYQIALDEGFIGTEAEWLDSLQGPIGPPDDPVVKLMTYYEVADGTDYGLTLARALLTTKRVTFPVGNFTFANPVDYVENMSLVGAIYPISGLAAGTVITANNGLVKNPNTTRKRIHLENLEVNGNGTAVCVDGPFGGRLENCRFEGFTNVVENASSYLSRYIRCSFLDCDTALMLADANGCRVEDCFFDADCLTSIDMVTVTPQSGSNNGAPIIISGNNINMSDSSGAPQTAMRLRGLIVGEGNYFEDYTPNGNVSDNVMVELTVGQFDKMGFQWRGNEMNGQGEAKHAILINGTGSGQRHVCSGVISNNRIIGFPQGAIEFGANNQIHGLRIFDNNEDITYGAGVQAPISMYRPMACGRGTTNTSIVGASYITIPISNTVVFDNTNAFVPGTPNGWRCRKPGNYEITCTVMLRTTASSFPNIDLQITNEAVEIATCKAGIVFNANPTYTQATISYLGAFALDDDVLVRGRGGDSAFSTMFTAKWLGDGRQ